MKNLVAIAVFTLSGLSSLFGLGVNVDGLGQSLNGWNKKRMAVYSIDNQTYRTHVPTVTENLDGGIFVSMRVEHVSAVRPDATGYIELTITPSGYVGAAQIRLTMNGEKYNTGQILREAEPNIVEGGIGSADWRTTHTKLVLDLFAKLDAEFTGEDKEGEGEAPSTGRRDLWGRLNGSRLAESDVSAALRHNLNLLIQNIGHQYASSYK